MTVTSLTGLISVVNISIDGIVCSELRTEHTRRPSTHTHKHTENANVFKTFTFYSKTLHRLERQDNIFTSFYKNATSLEKCQQLLYIFINWLKLISL